MPSPQPGSLSGSASGSSAAHSYQSFNTSLFGMLAVNDVVSNNDQTHHPIRTLVRPVCHDVNMDNPCSLIVF